ncbi:hypothetical protein EXIGLDRAFT_706154 [Exidia glandulosa HHB12029]|uniref:Uncharacterized protein n=1 Tax=Exidia glandulosa HHB12029 TaxID=1314781 RepID=A0A165B6I3_EXIGL|nr:hypothetical protein EXIGLDRAFT_706154 [Exidia glandulosa HHB12029]
MTNTTLTIALVTVALGSSALIAGALIYSRRARAPGPAGTVSSLEDARTPPRSECRGDTTAAVHVQPPVTGPPMSRWSADSLRRVDSPDEAELFVLPIKRTLGMHGRTKSATPHWDRSSGICATYLLRSHTNYGEGIVVRTETVQTVETIGAIEDFAVSAINMCKVTIFGTIFRCKCIYGSAESFDRCQSTTCALSERHMAKAHNCLKVCLQMGESEQLREMRARAAGFS